MSLLSKFLPLFKSRRKSDKTKDVTETDLNGKDYNAKVVLLDDASIAFNVKTSAKASAVLEKVFENLNLIEKDYFGLRFLDNDQQTHWLDPAKTICSQLKTTPPHILYFGVKFYAADPCKLHEEITRYQFFLQIKNDILQGRLPVNFDPIAELASYSVQSELGDYDPKRHSFGYVSEFRFVPNQTEELESKIAHLHRRLVGQVPAMAEYKYLDRVKWLEMYGVDLHQVQGEGSLEYYLGLTPTGIVVYRNKAKVGNYFWPRISKIRFKSKFFMVRVRDKNNDENTYAFECTTKAACKHLWKCCVEYHAFFRLTSANESYSSGKLFSLGSKYRFSGRTERQVLSEAANRAPPQVVRTPSRRHQRRPSCESAPGGFSSLPDPSSPSTTVQPEPTRVHRTTRQDGYHSAPESPHKNSAPWENNNRAKGGLYTSGSPKSVRSEKMMFPRKVQSGSESEAGNPSRRRHHHARQESETESEMEPRRHRRVRVGMDSGSESEAYFPHSRTRRHRKSTESLPHTESQWKNVQQRTRDGLSGPYVLRTNGSLTSMQSEPNQSNRRRRRRSKSPGHKPPEELAQHFKYVDPASEGLTAEQLQDIPYTSVETTTQVPKVKYSPRSRHRQRLTKKKSMGELSEKSLPAVIPIGEPPPPYDSDVNGPPAHNRHSYPNLAYPNPHMQQNHVHQPNIASAGIQPPMIQQHPGHQAVPPYQQPPEAYNNPYEYRQPSNHGQADFLMSPMSVQRTDTQTAPIVKTRLPKYGSSQGPPSQPQSIYNSSESRQQPINPHHQHHLQQSQQQSHQHYHQQQLQQHQQQIQQQQQIPTYMTSSPDQSVGSTSKHTRDDSGLGVENENLSGSSASRYFYMGGGVSGAPAPSPGPGHSIPNGWVMDPRPQSRVVNSDTQASQQNMYQLPSPMAGSLPPPLEAATPQTQPPLPPLPQSYRAPTHTHYIQEQASSNSGKQFTASSSYSHGNSILTTQSYNHPSAAGLSMEQTLSNPVGPPVVAGYPKYYKAPVAQCVSVRSQSEKMTEL